MLVTMRGEWAELNPWQNSAGGAAEEALRLMGVRTWRADDADDVEPLVKRRAGDDVRRRHERRRPARPAPDREQGLVTTRPWSRLDRRAVVRALLAGRGELVVVTGLGSSSYDTMAAGDHDLNYYLWGAMGSAAPVGLGLAIAQPRGRCS